MELAEFVIVPVVVAVLVAAALVSWRRHLHRTKLLFASAALGLDVWLWLAALEAPVGPHVPLVYALLLVNVPIACGLVYQSTGFQMNPRGSRPYADDASRARGEYDGYRGD